MTDAARDPAPRPRVRAARARRQALSEPPGAPWGDPMFGPALDRMLAALRGGAAYKGALEALLLELADDTADALMMQLKESRGAFALLGPPATPLGASAVGAGSPATAGLTLASPRARALFIGDALSGTCVALVSLGFAVTAMDSDPSRLAFAVARARAVGARLHVVRAGGAPRLPFVARAFTFVVQEDGLPTPRAGHAHSPAELRRVADEAVFVASDNRFGYKRSTGRRGDFVRDPRVFVREALAPSRGERSLFGTRRAVRGDWPTARAFALYPHAREFSHVVALDAPTPGLTVRRRERKNVLKVIGRRLGLFPVLTPSFGILATRRAGSAATQRMIDRMLDELAQHIGEPRPEVDTLIATRSNDAIIHTALPGSDAADPRGRWTLHIPLQASKERMVMVHHDWLVHLRRHQPLVPVPEPLFLGRLDGMGHPSSVQVAVERRMAGVTGADLTGDTSATARMFLEAAAAFAQLVQRPATPLDAARFDAVIGVRAELALQHVPNRGTRRALEGLIAEARTRMLDAPLPAALYHADLRAKHLAVHENGALLGVLDWGASEGSFLPYIDVLHLVIHQRKQEAGGSLGAAWRSVRDHARRAPHERAALDLYCASTGLTLEMRQGIEALYPVLVAGMAERNWDYSRPDWVHRHFDL
ncbi:MAG: hypothetical protein R3F49_14740 [Planctomycetota bacterium]